MTREALPKDDVLIPFATSTFTFKIVEGHSILADVHIPKRLLDGGPNSDEWKRKRPVLIRIHGGWLVGGQRNFNTYSPRWLFSLAYSLNAIIVAPDYRLLPEATVNDTLDDLDDFWSWVNKDLPGAVRDYSKSASGSPGAGLEVDLDRIVVEGESAGGYLAIQLALSQFKPRNPGQEANASEHRIPQIRILVSIYPMLDMRAPHWTKAYFKQIFDHPQIPESLIDDHLKAIANAPTKPIVSSDRLDDVNRFLLPIAYIQHGRVLEMLGPERDPSPGKRRIHPEDRLEDGAKLPPTFFVHGTEDSGVPVEGTDKFIGLIRKYDSIIRQDDNTESKDWDSLMYARVPGEHAFESSLGPEDAAWVKEGLDFIEKLWVA